MHDPSERGPAPALAGAEAYAPFGKPPENLPPDLPAPATRVAARGEVRIERIDLARRRDRQRFLDVGDAIQRGDPNYIAPLRMERMRFLDPAKNPAFRQLDVLPLLAVRDGQDVGRITAHLDRAYDAHHGGRTAFFGFLESVDDRAVAHALLGEAVAFARARGAAELFGPCNFTTNHQVGLLVENFDRPPCVEMTYNPAFYQALVESYGFGKAKDLLAFWIVTEAGLADPKLKRFFDLSEKAGARYGLTLRPLDKKDFANDVARAFRLYNATWEKNWGFVPVTEAEFVAIAHDLKPVLDPNLALFVEDRQKNAVGFVVCLPDVNQVMPRNGRLFPFGWWKLLTGQKHIQWARLFALGVLPEFRRKGVEAMLIIQVVLRAKERGIRGGEIGWTLEDNVLINRTIESVGGKRDRRYRIYGLDLR
jgi:ribosomal protein S18 acetylase RimI-like enzyme